METTAGRIRLWLKDHVPEVDYRWLFTPSRVQIDLDGDDRNVYVTHRSSGKPLGELIRNG